MFSWNKVEVVVELRIRLSSARFPGAWTSFSFMYKVWILEILQIHGVDDVRWVARLVIHVGRWPLLRRYFRGKTGLGMIGASYGLRDPVREDGSARFRKRDR